MSSINDFDHQGGEYFSQPRGFLTPPPAGRASRCFPAMPASERKPGRPPLLPKSDLFHVIHKVPSGDSPYVRAKHVQLIDKDPSKAISLFWAAINSGDRVDSALKDMAVVMKQLDRSDEAIEAIKSFRNLCPHDSQESLDNILLELYKQSGRTEEEIEMLKIKLKRVEEGMAFGGKRTKIARSQGKKVQVTVEKEYSRLLGNLAWAYMQQKDFKSAEENYRKALSFESDKNKQCNLAICLMHLNKLSEARFLLQSIRVSSGNGSCMDESYAKSYERASQMLVEFESQQEGYANNKTKPFCGDNTMIDGFQPTVDKMNRRAFTEFPYEKRADFDWRRKNNKQQLHTGQEAFKKAYYDESPFMSRVTPKVPFTQPRLNPNENSCRKLSFGSFMGGEKGMNFHMPSNLAYSDTTENEKKDRKMSWADMVEEEEEKKFGKKWRNDENRDSNIIILDTPNTRMLDQAEKLSQDLKKMVNIGSGYLTQPSSKAATNQTVRRSLCFEQNLQLGTENNNNNSSPLLTKGLSFEGNNDDLMVLSPEIGSDKSMKRRNRLQVFQDITMQKD